MTDDAQHTVTTLFEVFFAEPTRMPEADARRAAAARDDAGRARIVADYIAGMTDRYALAERARVTS